MDKIFNTISVESIQEPSNTITNKYPKHALIVTEKLSDTSTHYYIYITNEIVQDSVYLPIVDVLLSATENDVIDIFLQTVGGDVISSIAILSAIARSKAKITKIANGICASCGAILLFESSDRPIVIRDWARVMVHAPSQILYGKTLQIRETAEIVIRWVANLYMRYVEKGLLTPEEYSQIMDKKLDVHLPVAVIRERIAKLNGGSKNELV